MHFPFLRLIQPLLLALLGSGQAFAETTALQTGAQQLAQIQESLHNINTTQLHKLLQEQPETLVVDVRSRYEINQTGGGRIDAAQHVNILRGWLEFRIQDHAPTPETPIVVYCGTNERSPLAAKTLMEMGYHNVKNYADGFFAWRKANMPIDIADRDPNRFLYSRPVEVAEGVWSAIGETAPPTYENSGHNNNLSFIITDEGVVVINAGDNYLLAAELHAEIRKITEQPVKYVVLENEQGHAALGSHYWKEQGVPIIAQEKADALVRARGENMLSYMQGYAKDKAWNTELAFADETFADKRVLELGGVRIELLYFGPAHGPADVLVWLPQQELMIAGDLGFYQRMLPIFEDTDTASWLEIWPKLEALNPKIIIPGHGEATSMAMMKRDTHDYLVYMREQIGELLDDGGSLEDIYRIDQSRFAYLDAYRELSTRNASTLFRQMEFE